MPMYYRQANDLLCFLILEIFIKKIKFCALDFKSDFFLPGNVLLVIISGLLS
jgi:hypothetical protein